MEPYQGQPPAWPDPPAPLVRRDSLMPRLLFVSLGMMLAMTMLLCGARMGMSELERQSWTLVTTALTLSVPLALMGLVMGVAAIAAPGKNGLAVFGDSVVTDVRLGSLVLVASMSFLLGLALGSFPI